jgi:hypothetical protein
MPKIEVTINPDGSVRPDFFGFAGEACITADLHLRTQLAQFGLTLETVQVTAKPELFAGSGEHQQALLHQHLQELQKEG